MNPLQRATALATGAAMMATSVSATTVCYPREQMLSYISRDFDADREANGIVRPFSIMEIWVSKESGDWLIVTTDLDGMSCVVAYGEDYSSSIARETDKG